MKENKTLWNPAERIVIDISRKQKKVGEDKKTVQLCCLDNQKCQAGPVVEEQRGASCSSRSSGGMAWNKFMCELVSSCGYKFVCLLALVCVCVYLWHVMQQDHTVLVVCGISRFKIGSCCGRRAGTNRSEGEKGRRSVMRTTKYTTPVFIFLSTLLQLSQPLVNKGKFLWFTDMTAVMVSQMESGQIYLIGMLGGKEALLHCKQLKRKVKLLMDENISSLWSKRGTGTPQKMHTFFCLLALTGLQLTDSIMLL